MGNGLFCLGHVVVPDGAQSIGPLAFDMGLLTSIHIPASVTQIKSNAFSRALSLTEVSFAPSSQLSTIEADAFDRSPSLTSITIPAGVQTIGDWAFDRTDSLQMIRFLGNAPGSIGANTFTRVGSLGTGNGPNPIVQISRTATGFGSGSTWNGLTIQIPSSTLSLNSAGTVATQTLEFGETLSAPQLTRPGFTLAGWSATEDSAATFAADLSDFTMGPSAQTLFAVWEENPVATSVSSSSEEVAHPFSGPLLRKVDRRVFNADEPSTITFQGKRLHRIDSVKLDGKELAVVSRSKDLITLTIPAMTAGNYTLVIESKSGKLTLTRFIAVK